MINNERNFHLQMPPGCSYRLEPMSGNVSGQRDMCCALYFEPSIESSSYAFVTLHVEGGESIELRIIRVQEKTHGVVPLWPKKLLPPLSSHLIHYDSAFLFNTGYVLFLYLISKICNRDTTS